MVGNKAGPKNTEAPPRLQRYFAELANAERAEPIEIVYTEKELKNDLELIAELRRDAGWQTTDAQVLLDEMERETRERIERNYR